MTSFILSEAWQKVVQLTWVSQEAALRPPIRRHVPRPQQVDRPLPHSGPHRHVLLHLRHGQADQRNDSPRTQIHLTSPNGTESSQVQVLLLVTERGEISELKRGGGEVIEQLHIFDSNISRQINYFIKDAE